ncbi:MAG: hypothetical protein ABSG32_25805 [Terriglobia bacterium]
MKPYIAAAVSLIILAEPAWGGSQKSISQNTGGECSPAIVSQGRVTITCTGLDSRQQELLLKMPGLIDQLLKRSQSDRDQILAKLDEILKAQRLALSRRLSQQQIISLQASARSVCSMLPPISVTASNGNQEAQQYAGDFVTALKNVGCRAELSLPIPGLTPDVTGVLVGVRNMNNIDPVAQALKQILSDSKIQFSEVPMKPDFFPDEQSVLVVGARE